MTDPLRHLGKWWSRRTIRFRLALWYAAGGTLLLTLFATTLYVFVARRLARPLDHQLRQDLAQVQANLRIAADRSLWWNESPLSRRPPWLPNSPWFELWDESGNLVRRLWPFTENRALQMPGAPSRTIGTGTVSVFNVAPDLRIRSLSVPINGPDGTITWMVRLMRVHQPHADALPELRIIILATLPVVVALLVLGGHFFTRRWLLPLDRMAAESEKISIDDLSRRLSVGNSQDELGRLARVFNNTLDRLQVSFETLDRFVTDASHELRTPLTTLRSVGEVGLRRGRTVEEYREIIASMLEEAQRLQFLVERLLELASAEGGSQEVHRVATRLDEVANACIGELGILAEQRGQRLTVSGATGTTVTDPVLFRQALQNLIDNAIKYSPDGATIRVEILEHENEVVLTVGDEGPGIAPEDRTNLTQRFFRPDRARGRESGGFGLGLSITKAYLRTLGGSLEYEPGQPRGSIFRLRLPKR